MFDDNDLNAMFGFGSTDPISVGLVGNTVYVNALVGFDGNGVDDPIGNTTYRETVLNGIPQYWNGTYSQIGLTMSVVVADAGNPNTVVASGRNDLRFTINNTSGTNGMTGGSWHSYNDPGNIHLYNNNYSVADQSWDAAHEFGHALGIGDLYTDPVLSQQYPGSIMNNNSPRTVNATYMDINMVLRAHSQNAWQVWPNNPTGTGFPF